MLIKRVIFKALIERFIFVFKNQLNTLKLSKRKNELTS